MTILSYEHKIDAEDVIEVYKEFRLEIERIVIDYVVERYNKGREESL